MSKQWGTLSRKARRRGMTTDEYVQWLIEECGGVSAAARNAGVSRGALYHWITIAKKRKLEGVLN